MKAINSKLETLRRRAAKGNVEVEHLISFAVIGDPAAAPVIRELQQSYKWSRTNEIGSARVVPLARWAEVVCAYLDGGSDALIRYAKLPESGACNFALSVLREIKSPETVRGLIDFVSSVSTISPLTLDDRLGIADAINLTFSFKDAPPIVANDAKSLRSFLDGLLAVCETDSQRARVICALRGVGDENSIRQITEMPTFGQPWDGIQTLASNAIRNRLRKAPDA